MTLHPQCDALHKGVGYDLQDTDNSYIEACLHLALYNVRRHQVTPLNWHVRECYAAKRNEQPGPKGRRPLHILRVWGKRFFANCIKAKRPPSLPDEHHGYAKGRKKETAIMLL